jgi:4-cresol dehydrogenase (hydroxylating) flavoprotein subunit
MILGTKSDFEENSLGVRRNVVGVFHPESVEDVQDLVRDANLTGLKLYPVSRGRNIGYGEGTPVRGGQAVVCLERMNKINLDSASGEVVVGPGVTQGQLYEFLESEGGRYMMDVTGAGKDASVLGNALDGGFGHSPFGNKRREITDLEVVLGTGEILRTGEVLGMGPGLAGLFVQSNFGIVTSSKFPLMRRPESFESFFAQFEDDRSFLSSVGTFGELRNRGVMENLVHVGNYDRAIRSGGAASGIFRVGEWNAMGGIYGSSRVVRAKKDEIQRRILEHGRVRFFGDRKLDFMKKVSWGGVGERIDSLSELHGIIKGVPSDVAVDNLFNGKERDRVGLIWYCPVVPAERGSVENALKVSESLFRDFGFDMPLTLSFVEPGRLVGVYSIHFDKKDNNERGNAHSLYLNLNDAFGREGFSPYRTGIMGMEEMKYSPGKLETLKGLKKMFDPKGVIAPGRYIPDGL